MNKKNAMLAMVLMVVYSAPVLSIESLSAQEQALRVDYICRLSQANALSIVHYLENGAINYDLIDRDIELLKKDSQQAIKSKSWAEGYFYSWIVPGCGTLIKVTSGVSALAAGAATVIGSVLFYDVWNSSYVANGMGRAQSEIAKFSGTSLPERIEGRVRYWEAKADYLAEYSDYNRSILTAAPGLPVAFVGTMVLAAICRYSSNKLSNYKDRNVACIQQMQERYNNDLVAIAQLQEIVYQARLKQ